MTATVYPMPTEATPAEIAAQLKQYGIVRVPAETFEYGGYRYTNLKDAVSAAKRSSSGET